MPQTLHIRTNVPQFRIACVTKFAGGWLFGMTERQKIRLKSNKKNEREWARQRHRHKNLDYTGKMAGNVRTAGDVWLGREDSNLRMVESKSTALPLGDAPLCLQAGGP